MNEVGMAARAERSLSGDFVDPIDGYQDDDLIGQTEEGVTCFFIISPLFVYV